MRRRIILASALASAWLACSGRGEDAIPVHPVDVDAAPDAGTARDGAAGGRDGSESPPAPSRCALEGPAITRTKQTASLDTGLVSRKVHFELPFGTPPPNGWPVVLLFQGSLFSAEVAFAATQDGPFGAYHQTLTVKRLLDSGYAVLAPEAHLGGSTFWDTNVVPWKYAWDGAPDDRFVRAIFSAMDAGVFGAVDSSRKYAAGISSGGYMTSRMAVSYPGEFRALAVHSASYATCSGLLCDVPDALPTDHPPTLFLHGERDAVVPISTMKRYRDGLARQGTHVEAVVDADAGHAWIASAPEAIVTFFDAFR